MHNLTQYIHLYIQRLKGMSNGSEDEEEDVRILRKEKGRPNVNWKKTYQIVLCGRGYGPVVRETTE